MSGYYSEKLKKDTLQRGELLDGLDSFLRSFKTRAEKIRAEFISPEALRSDPEAYRECFIDMLGFPLREERNISEVQKELVAKDGNVEIFRMTFVFSNGLKLYGIYFKQIENAADKPFLFGLHGGAGTPEVVSSIYSNSSNYNHLVRRLTDKGASVFAPQLFLWDVREYGNSFDRLEIDGRLRQFGGTVTALELYLMQGALDYFIINEGVDAEKIGVAGMSYGGMYALYLAALDTRVKACYSCSWLCDVFEWVRIDWCYQNAQTSFAVAETAGLIAPRTLAVAMGKNDPHYKQGTAKEGLRIKSFYEAWGSLDAYRYIEFDGVHEVDKGDEGIDHLLNALKQVKTR